MLLADLLPGAGRSRGVQATVSSLALDSREVEPGGLWLALGLGFWGLASLDARHPFRVR